MQLCVFLWLLLLVSVFLAYNCFLLIFVELFALLRGQNDRTILDTLFSNLLFCFLNLLIFSLFVFLVLFCDCLLNHYVKVIKTVVSLYCMSLFNLIAKAKHLQVPLMLGVIFRNNSLRKVLSLPKRESWLCWQLTCDDVVLVAVLIGQWRETDTVFFEVLWEYVVASDILVALDVRLNELNCFPILSASYDCECHLHWWCDDRLHSLTIAGRVGEREWGLIVGTSFIGLG